MATKLIAEICQNHQGDRGLVREMIHAAAESGADIIKMQSMWSADLTLRHRFEEGVVDEDGRRTSIKRPHAPEFERLSKLDLSIEEHIFFIEECGRAGAVPMTAVFSRNRVREVGELPWPVSMVKVPSYDCASLPFLRELAEHFDNFIISTGATYNEEIDMAARLMSDLGKRFALLHCVTSYPNTLEMCNLSRMRRLRRSAVDVGWSDHTLVERDGLVAAKAAIIEGADYVERHFTILSAEDTKDGPVSITPEMLRELDRFRRLSFNRQLAELERECPQWRITLGNSNREMTEEELLNLDYYRGRFAMPHPEGRGYIFNWEDVDTSGGTP